MGVRLEYIRRSTIERTGEIPRARHGGSCSPRRRPSGNSCAEDDEDASDIDDSAKYRGTVEL